MKSTKLKVGALAMALVFAMSGSVFAAGNPGPGGNPTPDYPGTTGDAEYQTNADTTISVMSSKQNAGNMSYTVPLYVTMAVSNGQDHASVPLNYGIMNTSIQGPASGGTGGTDTMNIGVTGIRFDKISDATGYKTVETTPGDNMDINLMVGGIQMPALADVGSVTLTADQMKVQPTGTYPAKGYDTLGGKNIENIFQDASGKCKPFAVDKTVHQIPILAAVKNATDREDSKAAAQFRVRYDVSLLDSNGNPLGTVYAGSNYHQAGLDNAPVK